MDTVGAQRRDRAAATTLREPLLPPARPGDAKVAAGTLPPVVFKVPTSRPVVFLTIDDGWTASLPAVKLIRAHHLPVTAFLIDRAWRRHPAYFRALRAAGVAVEDHTLAHPSGHVPPAAGTTGAGDLRRSRGRGRRPRRQTGRTPSAAPT